MGDNVASVYVHSVKPYAVDYMVRHKDATNWKSTIACSGYEALIYISNSYNKSGEARKAIAGEVLAELMF
jgi:hypothetical protein